MRMPHAINMVCELLPELSPCAYFFTANYRGFVSHRSLSGLIYPSSGCGPGETPRCCGPWRPRPRTICARMSDRMPESSCQKKIS